MSKYLSLFTLLTLLLFAQSSMKCEAGKCASASSSTTKQNKPKNLPPQKELSSSMKCEAGKCASGTSMPSQTSHTPSKKQSIEQLFNVRTIEVTSRLTSKKQVNYGYVVIPDSSIVDVTPRYGGYVEKLFANTLYTKVEKGEALALVYSPEVYKAKQDYINSIKYNQKTAMPEMLRSAKIKLQLLGVSEKEINAMTSNHTVDFFTTIYAPISGWIFEKKLNDGSSFSEKNKLFEIVRLEKIWIEAKLFQKQINILDTLKTFEIKVEGIPQTFQATDALLYPMLDPKEATATLRLSVNNEKELLKPGMYVKIYSQANEEERLVIPRTAAIRKNGTWYAFLATDFEGIYEPVEISVKPLDTKHFEVLNGLQLGDKLVENALFMMDSDAQINSIY